MSANSRRWWPFRSKSIDAPRTGHVHKVLNSTPNTIQIVADGNAAVVRVGVRLYIQRGPMREIELHLHRSELRAYLRRVLETL